MFEKIKSVLNEEENINKYMISEEDLDNDKKINLYYILLKYIFKEKIYIYQIALLLKARKSIIKLLKSKNNFLENLNEDNKERLEDIIKIIIDSEYYKKKYDDSNIHQYSLTLIVNRNEENNGVPSISENDNDKNKGESKKFFTVTKVRDKIGDHKRKTDQNKKENKKEKEKEKEKKKEYTAEFVIETIIETKHFIISGGTNNEINIYIEDSSLQIKNDKSYPLEDWAYNILEIEKGIF